MVVTSPFSLRALLAAPAMALSLLATAPASAAPATWLGSYAIDMNPGTSNGGDVVGAFVFEWDALGGLHTDGIFTLAGRGVTVLQRSLSFEPVAALLIGYGKGIADVGDGKDHLYTLVGDAFAASVDGLRWNQVFTGTASQPRLSHSTMVGLLADAAEGDAAALTQLTNWVQAEGYRAAFDPAASFRMLEWTGATPVGGNVPEPGSLALIALGLAAAAGLRRTASAR